MAVNANQRLSQSLISQLRRANSGNGDFIPPQDLKSAAKAPLIVVLDNIFFFPLQWRKYIVDFCRIQQPVRTNEALIAMAGSVAQWTMFQVPLTKNFDLTGPICLLRLTAKCHS
jgi:hypothetical protein